MKEKIEVANPYNEEHINLLKKYEDKNQLANGIKLSDDAAIKDVLLSADHYAIGGAAWDAFTQRQKNDYKNNQQGGLGKTTDDAFNKWVQSGIVKN